MSMKVGVVSRGSPDYLIDIVMHGVVRLLGRENVALDYNIGSRWGGQYAILCHDVETPNTIPIEAADALIVSNRSVDAIKPWMEKTGKTKVAILDGEDDPRIRQEWLSKVPIYFKREYIRGQYYAKNVVPLPFGAIAEPVPTEAPVSRPVFFMGHETDIARRHIAHELAPYGVKINERVDKDEYNRRLASSLIGVSVKGMGWDCYRYWETPYFGVALLAQRHPLLIPDDFEEGKEACFFEGLEEFRTKLKWMLADSVRTLDMGRAAREKVHAKHLSVHRAQKVLDALS
jgi:glycosyl transferase family 1